MAVRRCCVESLRTKLKSGGKNANLWLMSVSWFVFKHSGGYHGYQDDGYGSYESRRMGASMGPRRGGSQRYSGQYGTPPPPPGEYSAHAESPVMMVYGLEPTKINADKVFNIFCLYGNVERVSGEGWDPKGCLNLA